MPEPTALTLLRPLWHYGKTPAGLGLIIGAGPHLKEMGESFDKRLQHYRQMGIETPTAEPGELPVANATSFVEKRAALQRTKTAQGGFLGSPQLFGGSGSLMGSVGQNVVGPVLGQQGKGPLTEVGERLRRVMFPSAIGRANVEEEMARSTAHNLGRYGAQAAVNLFGDLISKATTGVSNFMKSRAGLSIFNQLRKEDDDIARADPELLTDAYHTMVRFAPTLATDKNAVKTFLREAVLMGTGPNVVSIKQLADAERAVNPPPGK